MSFMQLSQKSEFNAEASKLLIDKSLYAPSVHCAYYAAFQLMKVAMRKFLGIEYNTIDVNVANSKSSEHKYIQREILNVIRNNDRESYRKINNLFNDLFQFRVEADYKNIEVKIDQASKANSYSSDNFVLKG